VRLSKALAATTALAALGSSAHPQLHIPEVTRAAKRAVTIDDVLALRYIDSLSVAPDGYRYVIFVHQGDASANGYRAGWFVGDSRGGALTAAGDGGDINPDEGGAIVGHEGRWSPDGRWIAYTLKKNGEVQLWRSRVDGALQEQLTRNAADVREFAWSEDGRSLFFTAGTPRAELKARAVAKLRQGYRYDEDFHVFTQLLTPPWSQLMETGSTAWIVVVADRTERVANEAERQIFERLQAGEVSGSAPMQGAAHDAAVPPVARPDGALAWLERTRSMSLFLRVMASLPASGSKPIKCVAEECSGFISNVWWSEDGERVLFYRRAGVDYSAYEFYAWKPSSGKVRRILQAPDDDFQHCSPATGNKLLCARQTATRPMHVASVDLRSAAVHVLADVNPEFRNIRLGKVERFEWDTPRFPWSEPGGELAGLYSERAYGYILYPPDFDPRGKYPVFVDPYYAKGFESSVGAEHAQHVYAANGFIVLKTTFPSAPDTMARFGAAHMKMSYSAELDFPHLSMYAGSTVKALDTAAARGFIDEHRVGIGGVSHGSFVPMYMMQKYDRIAAISLSSPGWNAYEYHAKTRLARAYLANRDGKAADQDWEPKPEGAGADFYRRIDLADHVDAIEAPILMNLAAYESYAAVRLIRYLSDADKAYDVYVFADETHVKWQPAHLQTIMNRNLDWFRFWLQDYEEPVAVKEEQYARWRKLRELQCRDPRSLRDFCGADNYSRK
jgi:dipeptidyl aminopeptidase/acylaminoacyl peptidase